MPRDRLDGIHTKEGRVVYDRRKHEFTLRDVQRILEKTKPEAGEETPEYITWLIWFVDNLSEYMVSVILAPVGLSLLADDVVEAIKAAVDELRRAVGDYLENARGPVGIPPGVF